MEFKILRWQHVLLFVLSLACICLSSAVLGPSGPSGLDARRLPVDSKTHPPLLSPDQALPSSNNSLASSNDTSSANVTAASLSSTQRKSYVRVRNNLPVTLRRITLEHEYTNEGSSSYSSYNVLPAGLSEVQEVTYWTGFASLGVDSWILSIEFDTGVVVETRSKVCLMRESDQTSPDKPLIFDIIGNSFRINLPSGGCDASISWGPANIFVFVRIVNQFDFDIAPTLSHQYAGGDHPWETHETGLIKAGGTSSLWVVNTDNGPFFDRWNINFRSSEPPPYGALETDGVEWNNKKRDKQCNLRFKDSGTSFDVVVGFKGWSINPPSGSASDELSTPLGYNSVAFIRIHNNFRQNIRYMLLKHRYSDDPQYTYTIPAIQSSRSSDRPVMIEFNSGLSHPGFDYWEVAVFLADGSYYHNRKANKECLLESSDVGSTVHNISVSESRLDFSFTSGKCGDDMDFGGHVDFLLGADPQKPYNKNTYLAAHNAFATSAENYLIANQDLTIGEQLSSGATTLLIDIWEYNDDIYMLHEWGKGQAYFTNNPLSRAVKLREGLETIKLYLQLFPDLVVTLVIEDRTTGLEDHQAALKKIFIDADLWQTIVFPTDAMVKGNWPTLAQLKIGLTRLVVFSSCNDPRCLFPYQWKYMTENVYSDPSLDPKNWTQPREDVKLPYTSTSLMAMNHFPGTPTFWPLTTFWQSCREHNTNKSLTDHVLAFEPLGIVAPNWLNLDFVEVGDAALTTIWCNARLHGKPASVMPQLVEGLFPWKSNTTETKHGNLTAVS